MSCTTSAAVRTNESARIIKLLLDAEFQVGQILLGQSRSRNSHTRQVHAFAVFQLAADQHTAMHFLAGDLFDLQFQQAIVEKNPVALLTSCGSAL